MKLLPILFISFVFVSQNHFAQTNCKGGEILNSKNCVGDDLSETEKELYDLVNNYRKENNLAEIPLSDSLCLVANRHVLDLQMNLMSLSHSWSDCIYDPQKPQTYDCILKAPKRFDPTYSGIAFENAYYRNSSTFSIIDVIERWKKSPLHNSVILNLDGFNKYSFNEGCVAIKDKYAVLWFSSESNSSSPTKLPSPKKGLGVSFEEAIKDINSIVPIINVSSIIQNKKWVGQTPNKSVIIEIFGTEKDIAESNMSLQIRLEKDRSLSVMSKHVLQTFLKNLSPKWLKRDQWLETALIKIKEKPNEMQKINVENISIELSFTKDKYLYLAFKPYEKPVPVEIK